MRALILGKYTLWIKRLMEQNDFPNEVNGPQVDKVKNPRGGVVSFPGVNF